MADPLAYFETQYQRQVNQGEFALNPFEQAALEFLSGCVLDLGCGLGNLALEAAQRGCRVLAVDASATGVARINRDAAAQKLPARAVQADLAHYRIADRYDGIVAIGLLMFFRRERALELLGQIKAHVIPGGCASVNVLIQGTSFMGMLHEENHYLFGRHELEDSFAGWDVLLSRHDSFAAPGGACKEFATVIARKPAAAQ